MGTPIHSFCHVRFVCVLSIKVGTHIVSVEIAPLPLRISSILGKLHHQHFLLLFATLVTEQTKSKQDVQSRERIHCTTSQCPILFPPLSHNRIFPKAEFELLAIAWLLSLRSLQQFRKPSHSKGKVYLEIVSILVFLSVRSRKLG